MKKIDVQQNTEEWLKAREGRVTGSRLGKFIAKNSYLVADIKEVLDQKGIEYSSSDNKAELEEKLPFPEKIKLMVKGDRPIEFYKYIVEKIIRPTGNEIDGEDPRDRGHRLETEAAELFCQRHGIEDGLIDDAFYVSDKDDRIGYSPDAVLEDNPGEGAEFKCLDPKYHLKYYVENHSKGEVPSAYLDQIKLAFIVNDDLNKMYLGFYCPQLPDIPYYEFEVTRKELASDLTETRAILTEMLNQADELITSLKESNDNF